MPDFARRPVLAAAALVAGVLTLTTTRYGYTRDELYFAMLEPAWGHLDQPPLVPLLARWLGGEVWLLRVPATLSAAGSVVVAALIARELGGDRRGQAWTAWMYAGTTAVLTFGHVLLTASLDLLLWPLIVLLVVRAELRDRPRLWLAAGAVAGVASYNKLLVALLLVALLVGLLVLGPRRRLASPYPWLGGVVALVLAAPNLAYQATNDWPQLAMGAALAESNAGEVRWFMWVFLLVVLGPPLVWVWLVGFRELLTREEWRPVRFVAALLPVIVVFTFVGGTQPYYPTPVLPVFLAAGTVVLVDRLAPSRVWPGLVAVNAAIAAVVSLPLLPVGVVGATPIPGMNQLVADAVGWPTYAAQVQRAWDDLPDPADAVVVTANYGEAGAVARYTDIPVYSGHNALHRQARPPDTTTTVVLVGDQAGTTALFEECERVDRLDNGVDVDNEEQGAPVAVCTGPVEPWPVLWEGFAHLD